MPQAHGIDVGSASLHLCTADPAAPPAAWPVQAIALKDPWRAVLAQVIQPGDLVALEPTGWYFSRPIVLQCEHLGALVLNVTHSSTKATREDRIASQKTDPNDARALAAKALDYVRWGRARGARPRDSASDALTIGLRLAIMARQRAVKASVQAKNRLRMLAHGIDPTLSQRFDVYLRAVLAGYAHPGEVIHLAAELLEGIEPPQAYRNATARRHLVALAEALIAAPQFEHPVAMLRAIRNCAFTIDLQAHTREDLDAELHELIHSPQLEPVTAAWLSAPGASDYTVATLHAATHCQAPLFDDDAFKAAVGCHPLRDESGVRQEAKEAKRGFKPAKAALHLWTVNLMNTATMPDNPVRQYFYKLQAAHNPSAIHAARGKLARILAGLARNRQPYRFRPLDVDDK